MEAINTMITIMLVLGIISAIVAYYITKKKKTAH